MQRGRSKRSYQSAVGIGSPQSWMKRKPVIEEHKESKKEGSWVNR